MHPLSEERLCAGETLPPFYGRDTMVLMARDPYWLFCYWELAPGRIENQDQGLGREKMMLRVEKFDHHGRVMNFFDIELDKNVCSWYIHAGEPDRSYRAHLGFLTPSGSFRTLLSSNISHTPRDGVSSVIDPLWGHLDFWQQRLRYRTLKHDMGSPQLLRREPVSAGRKGGTTHE